MNSPQGFILPAVLFALLLLGFLLSSIAQLAHSRVIRAHERQELFPRNVSLQNALINKQVDLNTETTTLTQLAPYFATWNSNVRKGSGFSLVLGSKNLFVDFPNRKPVWSALTRSLGETEEHCLEWRNDPPSGRLSFYRSERTCHALLFPLSGPGVIRGNLESVEILPIPSGPSRILAVQGTLRLSRGLKLDHTTDSSILLVSVGEIAIKRIEPQGNSATEAAMDLSIIALSGKLEIEEESQGFSLCDGQGVDTRRRLFLSAPLGIRYGKLSAEAGQTLGCAQTSESWLWQNSFPLLLGPRNF